MHGYRSANGTGEYFERSRKLPGRVRGYKRLESKHRDNCTDDRVYRVKFFHSSCSITFTTSLCLVGPSEQTPLFCQVLAVWIGAFGAFLQFVLLERNAQTLRTHTRSLCVLCYTRLLLCLPRTQVLDFVFALLRQTMRNEAYILSVQCWNEVIPFRDCLDMGLELFVRPVVQVFLDFLEEFWNSGVEL